MLDGDGDPDHGCAVLSGTLSSASPERKEAHADMIGRLRSSIDERW
jgi:hypothetical protein